MKLGVLFSSGKDSNYAMWVMKERGHEIACLILMRSRNKESYMFHTPGIDIAGLQAEAMGIPIAEHETEGEKEAELEDLEKGMIDAKERFGIEGVVTGALFSEYQKNRIEKVCKGLGLNVFSPLWHRSQEEYMRELLENGFRFVIVSVAAEGLDSSWLGREITHEDIDRLAELNRKNRINIAFEGGEAETLIIDSPMFRKRIRLMEKEINEENASTAVLEIRKAELEEREKRG